MGFWKDELPERRQGNRRTGPDDLTKYVRFSSFLAWLLLALTGILTDAATPSEFNIYVLDEKWDKVTGTYFRESYITAGFTFCIITFVFILVSLFVDSRRQKRKNDHFSYALLLALIVDVFGLIAFMVYYLS